MLETPAEEQTSTSPNLQNCAFSVYGQEVTADAAPLDLQTYVISAASPEARDSLAQALADKINGDNYQLVRKMTTLPYITVKFTRDGLQKLCQTKELRSQVTGIEADQAVVAA